MISVRNSLYEYDISHQEDDFANNYCFEVGDVISPTAYLV